MRSVYRSGFLFGSKGFSVAGSKIFFDLLGNHPAFSCPPAAAQTRRPVPLSAASTRSTETLALNSSFPLPGPPAPTPRKKRKTHHLPFPPDFLSPDFLLIL